MWRFIYNCILVLVLCCLTVMIAFCLRVFIEQDQISKFYQIRSNTRILCVGNSQTGCTWEDSESLGVETKWLSASSLPVYWMRLAEIERRGGFRSVRVVVVDCCAPARHVWEERIARDIARTLPISWRYIGEMPTKLVQAFRQCVLPLRREWNFSDTPANDNRRWTALSKEAQRAELDDVYNGPGYREPDNADDIVLEYLHRIHDICSRHGIKLILFFAPLVDENPNRHSQRLDKWKETLIRNGYEVLDYRNACEDVDFRDSHHLSFKGRQRFTRQHLESLMLYAQ